MFILLHKTDGKIVWVRPVLVSDVAEGAEGTEVAIDLRSGVRIITVTETPQEILDKIAAAR